MIKPRRKCCNELQVGKCGQDRLVDFRFDEYPDDIRIPFRRQIIAVEHAVNERNLDPRRLQLLARREIRVASLAGMLDMEK